MKILWIPILILLGIALQKVPRIPASTGHYLARAVIWVCFPALILLQLPPLLEGTNFGAEVFVPISMAWIQFALTGGLVLLIGRKLNWNAPTIGCMMLTCGLGNTSFVGFPLIHSLLGEDGLQIALLVDQPGTFLVLSTLGVVTAAMYSGQKASPLIIIRNVLSFPPFLAVILATVLWEFSLDDLGRLKPVLKFLSLGLVPLALLAVGFQLKMDRATFRTWRVPLGIGLTLKLVVMPAFFFLFYFEIRDVQDFSARVTILESAMAPMITGALLASDSGLQPKLASLLVSIGIPLSLLTVSFWNWILF